MIRLLLKILPQRWSDALLGIHRYKGACPCCGRPAGHNP